MSRQEKYAKLFAAEAREHLAETDRALLTLEQEPGDRASLDAAFRSVHTIKGMAAAMGYDVATRLAHNIESALGELRAGARRVDSDAIDLLLASADCLGQVVDATVAGKAPPDPAPIVERLVRWRLAEASAAARPPATAEPERARGAGAGLAGAPAAPRRSDASRVRVDIRRLDALMNLAGELTIVRDRLQALARASGSEPLQELVEQADRLVAELQVHVVESRMVPVWEVFDRFPRLVRDAARAATKEVELVISGKEMELDRSLLDAIADPLVHLIRNAVDHGIELPKARQANGKPRVGRIELSARRERSRVVIVVSDDGRGIDRGAVTEKACREGLLEEGADPTDQELLRIVARPGFSTAAQVTALSGRGVGLNVVEETVRGLGGSVELRSESGAGTTIRLELPLTLAIVPALIVEVAGQAYALPATFTRESFELDGAEVEQAHAGEWVVWRNERVPLTRLSQLFADGAAEQLEVRPARAGALRLVALEFGGRRRVVAVDRFLGEEEVVVKPFTAPRGMIPVFAGATVRADGRPALVLDAGRLTLGARAATPDVLDSALSSRRE